MRLPLLAAIVSITLSASATAADAVGSTKIARWKDDKACAFILMFDDSAQTDVTNVVPELTKRSLPGTFYVNPGSGQWTAKRQAWEKDIPAAGMFELANHTFTHKGGKTVDEIASEVSKANEAIHAVTPTLPWPRLVSYGQPGGIKKENWPATKAELAAILVQNHLIDRPDFGGRGAMINLKTSAEMLAHADKAIAQGSMECIVFHGVGGDWIVTPLPMFIEVLDGIVARKDQMWLTGHIPAHQYATERDSATVKPGATTATAVHVQLTSAADPKFYDQALTLITTVPTDWKTCTVDQGKRHAEATVKDGVVRYNAVPGSDEIVLTKH
jgi:hypothetical protein